MEDQPITAGVWFWDMASGQEMLYAKAGPFAGWILYRHPDGQFVTLRRATDDDERKLAGGVVLLVK